MLERRSALAAAKPYESAVLAISENPGFTLTQVAGFDADFEAKLAAALGALPEKVGIAHEQDGRAILRIGPAQFWIVGPETGDIATKLQGQCAITPLSDSRVRIRLEGVPARDVLAKLIPIDVHPSVFTEGRFALTGIHHTPVTVHCTGANRFAIYALRTFALNVWDVITDAALEYC